MNIELKLTFPVNNGPTPNFGILSRILPLEECPEPFCKNHYPHTGDKCSRHVLVPGGNWEVSFCSKKTTILTDLIQIEANPTGIKISGIDHCDISVSKRHPENFETLLLMLKFILNHDRQKGPTPLWKDEGNNFEHLVSS